MLLIAGLGNPGSSYAGHRHNVGFMAVDEIAREPGFSPWSRKFQGQVSEGLVAGEKVVLLKPSTFMNLSGQSVGEALRFFKLEPNDLLVIHDELDLAPGKLRVKAGGGNGGHNGLKSIDAHVGKEYRRVRIGIGHPGSRERVHGHVLSDFARADRDWLEPLLWAIARNFEPLVKGEDALFMNRIHMATGSDEPAGAKGSPAAAPAGAPAKGQSHIRQARGNGPAIAAPKTGPMADMLKRLFGKD